MTIVYGASDDLVEIEEDGGRNEEIDCYDKVAQIEFKDGTVIEMRRKTPSFRYGDISRKFILY